MFAIAPNITLAQNTNPATCHHRTTDTERLLCYDAVTNYEPPVSSTQAISPEPAAGDDEVSGDQWRVSSRGSMLDNRTDVFLSLESLNTRGNSIGRPERASLYLRCFENRTAVLLMFNQYISDAQNVRFKLDDGPVRNLWMNEVNGSDGLISRSGGPSIEFIKGLLDKDQLVVSFNSYSSNGLEFSFDISGLRRHAGQVASACNWSI
ncbi:type VI secretion system-associated protein TagO [Ketogulonicigenium vulgare]|uniref:type VI secretion system-associated protein TagO n=1 Tax=Ketogulonicigenium vulgare TaxID=92945 RepID=UPI003B59C684